MKPYLTATLILGCTWIDHPVSAQLEGHGADFTGVYNNTGQKNSGFGGPAGDCRTTLDENLPCNTREYPYNELGRSTTIGVLEDVAIECEVGGLVRLSGQGLYSFQVWHEPEAVKIAYEYGGVVRTIHLNGNPAPQGTPHTPEGYSTGEWNGDVLHVETTHLTPDFATYIGGREATTRGGPTSEQARVTERIWLSRATEGALMIEMTLDDPVYYTEPFVWARWKKLNAPMLSAVDEWDCIPAGDLLLNEDPDLDAFFDN